MTVESPNSSRRPRYWPLLKWSFFVVLLIFIGRRAVQLWASAPPEPFNINGFWLIPAALAYFAGWLPSVWFWRALLRKLRQPLEMSTAVRAYYVGHVGKYVPGKALVLVIRGGLVKDAGVNPVLAGVTAAYETLVFMAAGAALALGLAPLAFGKTFWSHLPAGLSWLRDQPVLLPLIVALATFATTPFSAWLFTKIGRKAMPSQASETAPPPAISAGLISQGVAVASLGWACHALSLGFVLQSISKHPFDLGQFPVWLAAVSLSTVGGFVVLIAPGGLGVREGLLIEALKDQPQIGPTLAVVAAGLLRALWFVTELIVALILYVTPKRSR